MSSIFSRQKWQFRRRIGPVGAPGRRRCRLPSLFAMLPSYLERDVVVGTRRAEVRILRRCAGGAELRLATPLGLGPTTHEPHRVGDDLDCLALRAVLRLPLAP